MKRGTEMLSMKNLENMFKSAAKNNHKYVGVKIEMEGFAKPEIIINQSENFETKLAYYQKSYNDDLTLKSFKGIKIVGLISGNDFAWIEQSLM